jgi:hypothetical protein
MSFVGKLMDGKDSTVEAPIVFVGLSIVGVLLLAGYALVARGIDISISDVGSACGWILGGGAAAQAGQGASRKMDRPKLDESP